MVKGVLPFSACNRGRPRALLFGAAGCLLLLLLQVVPPAMAQPLRDGLGKAADLPPWHVVKWQEVYRPDLTYFAWFSCPLGDINDDGYDDFAISSRTDTTYIFLGGAEFSHDPAFKVLGGGSGVASADFNGDGKLDIVTAIDNAFGAVGEDPPERRGIIRVYLWKEGPVTYDWEPDRIIQGAIDESVGKALNPFRSSVQALDYNGDGQTDFITVAYDSTALLTDKAVLYLGGSGITFTRASEIKPTAFGSNQHYAFDIMTGDINGDGYRDVFVYGDANGFHYWDVFLGNAAGSVGLPDLVLRPDLGWSPAYYIANIMDVDADGYDDILDAGPESIHKPLGDALLFRGRARLPQVLLPDDSIMNTEPVPMGDLSPQIVCPVGDMNGDGKPDLILGWNTYFFSGASAYYFYPGGSAFRKPLGFFGTDPVQHYIRMGVFPVGDVNGDGYDDVLTRGQGYRQSIGNRFQIWLGARQLRTGIDDPAVANSFQLLLSPNPLPTGATSLRIIASGLSPGAVEIVLHDLLGNSVTSSNITIIQDSLHHQLQLPALTAGTYFLTLRQGTSMTRQKLVVF